MHRAVTYVGRKLRPNQVVLDGGAAMVSYRFEPAGSLDSQGYHSPGSNYSTLENQHIDYGQLAYAPVTYALAPGAVNKAEAHLNTAYAYGTDKLFNREGRPARRPVPAWLRKVGVAAGDALTNARKGRLTAPKPQLTHAQIDAMLLSRSGLAARARQLFHVGDADPAGAAGMDGLMAALEPMGTETYPVPTYQKQALLIEALAVATEGNLAEAIAAVALLRRGLEPAAADSPVRSGASTHGGESVAWRVAQLLATAGGDGFDTLLLAGAVRQEDSTALLPARGYSPAARKQQALRVYLEARAQVAEAHASAAPPGGSALRAALLRESAAQATVKLWINPRAGDGGDNPHLAAGQRLTRAEKNAYYEWTQQFGRPGTQGMAGKTRERLHKLVTTYMERAQERGDGDAPPQPHGISSVWPAGTSRRSPRCSSARAARIAAHPTKSGNNMTPSCARCCANWSATSTYRCRRDFDSLARNLLNRELVRHCCAQVMVRRVDGTYVRRPLEGKVDRAGALATVKVILGSPAGTDPLTPALRALVRDPAAVSTLAPAPVWRSGLFNKDAAFSLALLDRLINQAGIGANVMSDRLLDEFGLNAANRNHLPPGMAKYRLFGNDGAAPATVSHFLARAPSVTMTTN